jgi:GT2 family glycosyltransferase
MSMTKPVTVIVPVYADWPSLADCINSLKEYVDTRHTILLVNDCGPEADALEKNIKEVIKNDRRFRYYRNPKNLGFVKTCNQSVKVLDKTKNDILLLNSDTKATEGFLEEMLEVMYSESKIGAVSPRTNNATIFTIPISAMANRGLEPQKSYEVFRKTSPKLPRYNEVPTAHGFCMLIKRIVIAKYGLFDEIFGKGYGEENDFSMRIKKHGYINVVANRAYVFHMEARSFTMERKSLLIKTNRAIIDERYPSYKNEVNNYIRSELTREGSDSLGYKLKLALRSIRNLVRRTTN